MRIECKSCQAGLDIPYQRVPDTVIVVCPLCGSRHYVAKAPERSQINYLGSLYPVLSGRPEPNTVRAWLSLKCMETRVETVLAAG